MFVFVLLCITLCQFYSFQIILKRKGKLVALLLLSYRCFVTVNDLWLFLTVRGLVCSVGLCNMYVVYLFCILFT